MVKSIENSTEVLVAKVKEEERQAEFRRQEWEAQRVSGRLSGKKVTSPFWTWFIEGRFQVLRQFSRIVAGHFLLNQQLFGRLKLAI